MAELPADDEGGAAVADSPDCFPAVSPAECLGRFAAEAEHFRMGLAATKGYHHCNPGIWFRRNQCRTPGIA